MKKIELSEVLINKVLSYLAARPYVEVRDIIQELMNESRESVAQIVKEEDNAE